MAIWIIVGGGDGDFTTGSRKMYEELKKVGADVHLTEVPNEGHGVWGRYYGKRRFYQWFLFHRKHAAPAADRFKGPTLLDIGTRDPDQDDGGFTARILAEFGKFRPYWQILNCGNVHEPGLKPLYNGKRGVFLTHPLSRDAPCVLQTTWDIPKGQRTALTMTVGHAPQGQWELVVRQEGQTIHQQVIGPQTATRGWVEVSVDLTRYAGTKARLEVLNKFSGDRPLPLAAFARIEVQSH